MFIIENGANGQLALARAAKRDSGVRTNCTPALEVSTVADGSPIMHGEETYAVGPGIKGL